MARSQQMFAGREGARSEVEYAQCDVTLVQRTDAAVLVDRDDLFDAIWLPLRALDGAGRVAVNRATLKEKIKIGVELRLAQQKGLV